MKAVLKLVNFTFKSQKFNNVVVTANTAIKTVSAIRVTRLLYTATSIIFDLFSEVLPSEEDQISVDSRKGYVRESRVCNSMLRPLVVRILFTDFYALAYL